MICKKIFQAIVSVIPLAKAWRINEMDNKNNFVSNQLIAKYPHCISDILA